MSGQEAAAAAAAAAATSRPPWPLGPVEDEYELMTIDEIINGQHQNHHHHPQHQHDPARSIRDEDNSGFPGLIPLVESYLDAVNVDVETRCELAAYLDLIRNRASGRLWTGARWIRHFVGSHEDYRGDSVVSERICYDLIKAVEEMGHDHHHHHDSESRREKAKIFGLFDVGDVSI